MEKMKRMLRFEEKAHIRQRFLEVKNKTMQTGWMLNEWAKKHLYLWVKLMKGGEQ